MSAIFRTDSTGYDHASMACVNLPMHDHGPKNQVETVHSFRIFASKVSNLYYQFLFLEP